MARSGLKGHERHRSCAKAEPCSLGELDEAINLLSKRSHALYHLNEPQGSEQTNTCCFEIEYSFQSFPCKTSFVSIFSISRIQTSQTQRVSVEFSFDRTTSTEVATQSVVTALSLVRSRLTPTMCPSIALPFVPTLYEPTVDLPTVSSTSSHTPRPTFNVATPHTTIPRPRWKESSRSWSIDLYDPSKGTHSHPCTSADRGRPQQDPRCAHSLHPSLQCLVR
jgi:hypothetical protein